MSADTAPAEPAGVLQVRFLFERPSAWELVRKLEPAAGPGVGCVSCSASSTQAPEQRQQQALAGRPVQLTFSRRSQVRGAATSECTWVCVCVCVGVYVDLASRTFASHASFSTGHASWVPPACALGPMSPVLPYPCTSSFTT